MLVDGFTAFIPFAMIFGGCCSNVISLELIINSGSRHYTILLKLIININLLHTLRQDTKQSNLITFAQFAFVAFISLFFNLRWKKIVPLLYVPIGLQPRKIPLSSYALMVFIFFLVSILNNWALSFNIGLPFHMVFRSSSLISTVVIGSIFFKKQYTMKQVVSLLMVTLGITIATLNSVPESKKQNMSLLEQQESFFNFLIGITMLTVAMFMSSVLGLIQEHTYRLYGKQCHKETIFYSHILALPFFMIFYSELQDNILANNHSIPMDFPLLGISVPSMWIYLLINVVTQYICIQGVFILTGKTSTLTCTLVISIRKFISIIFSVIYFNNPFTSTLWTCTALVLLGTFIYSDPFKKKEPPAKEKAQ
ncbi:Putative Permease [Cavenderia fasciculata]|uniref:Permease n=1 Tax=Cavenderia fasciculata TaxID=261658 RepID=F4PG58_CACFS|nr:Putative Permease [Cavenderia fasciculata]EGG24692.1 Putative Permease [Cavenderia fasciculata]|eukprot:XP_004362543.1 Putative Permease [Cavenderia fasciculata]